MNKLHHALKQRSPLYTWWHNDPHYKLVHWVVFILVGSLITLAIIASIFGQYPHTAPTQALAIDRFYLVKPGRTVATGYNNISFTMAEVRTAGSVRTAKLHVVSGSEVKDFDNMKTGDSVEAFGVRFNIVVIYRAIHLVNIRVTGEDKILPPPPPPAPSPQPHVSGEVRGVSLFYLDGVQQDFPWILEHQYEPEVRAKLDNLLAAYRAAGVNWIRILVAAGHHPYFNSPNDDPSLPPRFLKSVNDFMAITRSGPNAGKFTIEVVLGTKIDASGLYADPAPYTADKQWLTTWINGLDRTNIGMILIGGDLQPCQWNGNTFVCAPNGTPAVNNHGAWLVNVWPWAKQNWPTLPLSYEVIAGTSNTTELITKEAQWISANTPTVSPVAVSLYFDLPAGSSWQDYADITKLLLNAYSAATNKPLWIDEYGKSMGNGWSEVDQKAYYDGFLAATTCLTTQVYPKFAWLAGNDYPYAGHGWGGLVSGFTNNIPNWRPAWDSVAQYYNLATCP